MTRLLSLNVYFLVVLEGMLILDLQVKDNPSGDFRSMYRHISKGAWTFSDQDHGWQLSDCTAEGLNVPSFINLSRKDTFKCAYKITCTQYSVLSSVAFSSL